MIKTRVWICLLGGLLLASLALLLWPQERAQSAEIWSDGVLVRRVSVAQDQSFTVDSPYGSNTVTIQNGAIAVTQSDCPGGDCIQTGWRQGGQPIVCLPHRLVVQFSGGGGPDAVTG